MIANEYRPWLLGFIIINVIATFIMNTNLELIGDLAGTSVNDVLDLWLALFYISISYIIIMSFVFSNFMKIKFKKIKFDKNNDVIGTRLGIIISVLQILFFIFNSFYGVNTAGSNNTRVDTPLAFIWVLIPADTLFVIYYAYYRNNRMFKLNLVIWLLSNFLRGWMGVFLFVIFFEWCLMYRKGVITYGKVILASIVILVVYPLLSVVKWVMRASGGESIPVKDIATNLSTNLAGQDYIQLIHAGFEHIISRLQLTSVLTEVINMKDKLQVHYEAGHFLPFWMEGLHGIVIERLLYDQKTMYLGTAFTEYANFGWEFVVGDWNINLSLPAWFIIAPYFSVFYIIYILLLCFFSIMLMKSIGETKSSNDLIWLVWFVYLIPLWLGTFVAFIYAMFVFLILKFIFSKIPSFKLL